MSACSTCGKCPCYEHERKTVMVAEPKGHAERMAELLEDFRTDGNDDVATFHELHEYADELAAQLEAERSKVAELEGLRKALLTEGRFINRVLQHVAHNYDALGMDYGVATRAEYAGRTLLAWLHVNAPETVDQDWPRVDRAALTAFRAAPEKLKAAEERLQAAERVIERVGGLIGDWGGGLLAEDIREALSAFDAINPDGSTGGSGEGVG